MAFSIDDTFRRAVAALQVGKINDAEQTFKAVLDAQPNHVAALNFLSIVLTQLGKFGEAEQYVQRALKENAASDATLYNYGLILKALKRPTEALERFTQALAINPAVAETWNNRGAVFNELSRYQEACADFDKAIAINSKYAAAYCNKAKSSAELKLYEQSLGAYDRALSFEPNLAEAWGGRGNVLMTLKRYDDALAAYDRAVALKPDLAEAWAGRGNVFVELGQNNEAGASFDRALALNPDLAAAWLGRGNLLAEASRCDEASAAYDKALALKPDLAEAWLGHGNVIGRLHRYNDAAAAYDRALALKPDLAEAWLGHGNIFSDRKMFNEASAAFDKALTLMPDLARAWFGQGAVFFLRRLHHDALDAFNKAIAIKPELKDLEGSRLHTKMYICDWTNLDLDVAHLLAAIKDKKLATIPFGNLSIPTSAEDQYQYAKHYVANQPSFPAIWRGERYSHDRIRIAYVSADLYDHPMGRQMVGLFEQHDKSRFEITAISLGPDQESEIQSRIKGAVGHFVDVQAQDDRTIADLLRQREIDIAVDLNGFTDGGRQNVFALRPAPIQVNYLGYAGTLGADYLDYILADKTVIPDMDTRFYSENVIWLPNSFMATDSHRRISEHLPARRECALPETGFVFCCFNATYKISPDMFRSWMNLLKATAGSVLWLSDASEDAKTNLRREAEQSGVSSDRLIFAPRVASLADHLARQGQADLFLDTLPYNAHATAVDALWAGLPVLTCLGQTFAGRVAASLLNAVGLPELITTSHKDYEELALKLTRDADQLRSLKAKLARNRETYPLFDTKRFAQNIETAYFNIWERYQRGESPTSFAVNASD